MKKFYNINLSEIVANTTKYNKITGKELKAFILLLSSLTFGDDKNIKGGNVIKVTKNDKELIMERLNVQDSFYRKLKSKLVKSGILAEIKKDTFKVNTSVINRGFLSKAGWENVKFMKVNMETIVRFCNKCEDLSAKELSILFYILSTTDVDTNTLIFDKEVKGAIAATFNVSSRTLDTLMKKIKSSGLITKLNNKEYKINSNIISCRKEEKADETKNALIPIVDLSAVRKLNCIDFIKASRNSLAVADKRIEVSNNNIIDMFYVGDACLMQ